jgi:ATP phosphoribosyltransferase
MTDRPIRVALPNKGRLSEQALGLLEQAGLRTGFAADRALMAPLGDDFQAIFVRTQDIPEYVADGAAELGVTGADCVAESGRDVSEVLDLGFGRCRLIVAAPEASDVRSPEELPAGTRVATSFPRCAKNYFDTLGIADVIVDITSTGSTLQAHSLREIGTIMESTARVVANPAALADSALSGTLGDLSTALESVLRAREKRYLMANVPKDKLEEVRQVIPGLSGPTIVEVLDGGSWVAAHAVVDADLVYQTISRLKELGAEGILVTKIERLMP